MEKNVIEYYVLCNKLKSVIRTGWKDWKVNKDRLESVAEHIYGVQMLAIAMYSEYRYNINLHKVLLMLAIHELEEIIIGDLTCFEISESEKNKLGHEAIEKVLEGLKVKEELKDLILEFDARKTKEAIFAYHCDKLECDIQCKLYDEENLVDIGSQDDNRVYRDKRVKELLKNGEVSWSDMWLDFDKDKFADDENFTKVLEYVKNNKIS